MTQGITHAFTPLLILCACILTAQVQAPTPALSNNKSESEVGHISFSTEDGGLICAFDSAWKTVIEVWYSRMAVASQRKAGSRKRNPWQERAFESWRSIFADSASRTVPETQTCLLRRCNLMCWQPSAISEAKGRQQSQ